MTDALITLDNVTVSYGNAPALHNVSGSFNEGSLTAVAGPNGAGKSTLLKAIVGIIKPREGRIVIAPRIKGRIAYLPQTAAIQRDIPLTVMHAVCTGFWPQTGSFGGIDRAKREQALAALNDVGLNGFADRSIGELSGGQFQRMLFARVMLQDARVLLLDEPFAAVDAETTAKLIQIMLRWHEEGRTIICVLHDLLLIRKYFPESFILAGKCLGRGHTHTLFEQKLLSFDLDMAELLPGSGEAHDHATHNHHEHNHDHS